MANPIVVPVVANKKSISTRFNIALLLFIAGLMMVLWVITAFVTSQRGLLELDDKLSTYLQLSATALEQPFWNFDNEKVEVFSASLMHR